MIESICCFFYENKAFYANALDITGQNSFSEYFSEIMREAVAVRTDELFDDDENREFFATFFTDAFLATISRWLREGANTDPKKLTELIYKAVTTAAVKVLDAP